MRTYAIAALLAIATLSHGVSAQTEAYRLTTVEGKLTTLENYNSVSNIQGVENKINTLGSALAALNTDITDLETALNDAQTAINALTPIEDLEAYLAQYNTNIESLEDGLQTNIHNLGPLLMAGVGELADIREQVATHTEFLDEFNNRFLDFQATRTTQENMLLQEIEILQNHVADIDSDEERLEQDLFNANQAINEQSTRLGSINGDIGTIGAKTTDANSANSVLNGHITSGESDLQQISDKLNTPYPSAATINQKFGKINQINKAIILISHLTENFVAENIHIHHDSGENLGNLGTLLTSLV